jgi:hypothetical protein
MLLLTQFYLRTVLFLLASPLTFVKFDTAGQFLVPLSGSNRGKGSEARNPRLRCLFPF